MICRICATSFASSSRPFMTWRALRIGPQGVAQLVSEHRQEFVLAPVGLGELFHLLPELGLERASAR